MEWRNEKPTQKQLMLIHKLEADYRNFTGTTRGEASDYIDEAFESYRRKNEEESWYQESLHENAGDRI